MCSGNNGLSVETETVINASSDKGHNARSKLGGTKSGNDQAISGSENNTGRRWVIWVGGMSSGWGGETCTLPTRYNQRYLTLPAKVSYPMRTLAGVFLQIHISSARFLILPADQPRHDWLIAGEGFPRVTYIYDQPGGRPLIKSRLIVDWFHAHAVIHSQTLTCTGSGIYFTVHTGHCILRFFISRPRPFISMHV